MPFDVHFEMPPSGGVKAGYSFGLFLEPSFVTMLLTYAIMLGFLYKTVQKLKEVRGGLSGMTCDSQTKPKALFFKNFFHWIAMINYVCYTICVVLFGLCVLVYIL